MTGGGLYIMDVGDYGSLQKVGSFYTGGNAKGIYVSSNYAYVASDWNGLHIIDVSNPSNPREVSYYDVEASDVYVSWTYAYVADYYVGLRIIDVSDPANLQEVSYYDTGDSTRSVTFKGSYAYITDLNRGLRIIDVSDPFKPQEVGYYDTEGYANGVFVSGNYVYVANRYDGIYILKFTGATSVLEDNGIIPKQFTLHQNYPNPFNPATTIRFSLPKSTNIALKIFSLHGEEIETVVKGKYPAGLHEVRWNAGNLASGVYLYQLQAGNFVETKKMILIK